MKVGEADTRSRWTFRYPVKQRTATEGVLEPTSGADCAM